MWFENSTVILEFIRKLLGKKMGSTGIEGLVQTMRVDETTSESTQNENSSGSKTDV